MSPRFLLLFLFSFLLSELSVSAAKTSESQIRIWNFCGSMDKPVRLDLVGASEPTVLGRGLYSGLFYRYRPGPVGKFHLVLRADANPQNREPEAKIEGKSLAQSDSFELKEKQFYTIAVYEQDSRFYVELLSDNWQSKKQSKLRAFQFLKGECRLFNFVGNKENTLIPELTRGRGDLLIPEATGLVVYGVDLKRPDQIPIQQTVEVDWSETNAASIILYADRYGRPAIIATQDRAGHSEEAEDQPQPTLTPVPASIPGSPTP
jgi:hypothetical protein